MIMNMLFSSGPLAGTRIPFLENLIKQLNYYAEKSSREA